MGYINGKRIFMSPKVIIGSTDGVTTTLEISEDGYWVIGGVKTEHLAVGQDGATPYIGDDGYWYIDGNNIGVKASGTDGVGISDISLFETNGNKDTYRITLTNGNTAEFTVTNGTKGEKGDPGVPFKVTKTYASIDAMNKDYSNTSVEEGSFVMIDTGNVNDADNAKLFIKGATAFVYIADLSGSSGIKGDDGKSAYKLAQETGFEGSLSDWLSSLVGANGKTPYIQDGYWYIDGVSLNVKAAGVDGTSITSIDFVESNSISGVTKHTYRIRLSNGTYTDFVVRDGAQGKRGERGATPTIGVDGYWYIDGENTNVKAEGADGRDGKNGVTPTVEISTDGYWVINGVKTTTKAAGTDGKDGEAYVLTDADKKEIAGLVDETSTIPNYWQSELETKADAIQQAMEKAGRKKSAFLWYTDAHWVNGNSKVSPKLLNYLYMNTPMNKVNFGGDIIGDTLLATRDEMKYLYEWRKAIKDLPKHHSVFGNHDMFDLDSVDYEDDNYRYAFLLAPEETSDMVFGDGNYYYIDNPAEKTRYLYIAYLTSDQNAMLAQGTFIVDAIKSVPEGWHIVAIAHRWWQYSSASTPTTGSIPNYESEILSVFDAYNARTTRSDSNYFDEQDFTQAKGKVEFCIGGHIHVDYDIESEGGIPIIITTADANQNRVPNSTVDSGTVGTTTEAAVYGIIADYNDANSTKITVVGVGRGTSRVIRNSSVKPTSISNITYSGDTTIGATIDKSKFSFTVNYSDGTTDTVTGANSVDTSTIEVVGDNSVTITYTEGGVTVSGTYTIVGTPVPVVNLLNLNRTYVSGTEGEKLDNHLDESKAYTNVSYGSREFEAKTCTVSDVTENSVTVKESGLGGVTVAYYIDLQGLNVNELRVKFDYSGAGKCRTYFSTVVEDGTVIAAKGVHHNETSGASGSADTVIDFRTETSRNVKGTIIYLGSNTSGTKTFSNMSVTVES